MDRESERAREIDAAVADVRAIEKAGGVTAESLEKIKARLIRLAARTDLFSLEDYPPPQPGSKRNSCLYRISEDADHRLALEQLHRREYYKSDERAWAVFPPHSDIREARFVRA